MVCKVGEDITNPGVSQAEIMIQYFMTIFCICVRLCSLLSMTNQDA